MSKAQVFTECSRHALMRKTPWCANKRTRTVKLQPSRQQSLRALGQYNYYAKAVLVVVVKVVVVVVVIAVGVLIVVVIPVVVVTEVLRVTGQRSRRSYRGKRPALFHHFPGVYGS